MRNFLANLNFCKTLHAESKLLRGATHQAMYQAMMTSSVARWTLESTGVFLHIKHSVRHRHITLSHKCSVRVLFRRRKFSPEGFPPRMKDCSKSNSNPPVSRHLKECGGSVCYGVQYSWHLQEFQAYLSCKLAYCI